MKLPRVHQRQAEQDRNEAEPVDQERHLDAEQVDDDATKCGPDKPGAVEQAGVQRDRVHQVVLAHHFDDERLSRRLFERVRQPQHERQHVDVP